MAEKRKALTKFITPKGVAVYPRLNTPDTKYKPEGEYSAKIRLSEEDAAPLIEKINALIEATYKEEQERLIEAGKKGAAKTLKYADLPYKAVLDDEGDQTGEYEFNVKMKAQYTKKDGSVVKMEPKLFDAATPPNPLPKSTQIWGGSLIKVAGEFNPFATAIGVGMSLRLSAVQVIKLVSGSGGGDGASYGFGGEEGGHVAEGSEFSGEGDTKDDAPEGDEDF
jgi:hypothetical protein